MSKGHVFKYTSDPQRAAMVARAMAATGASTFAGTVDVALDVLLGGKASPQLTLAPVSDGARLKAARVAAGLSQRDLGEVCGGFSRATIVACENQGRAMPDALRAWLDAQAVKS